MFNNFNNLLELIEEDTELAGKFLSNLSKVYRYIITNLDRNLIPVADEIKFLDSYLYLMKVRHNEGVIAKSKSGRQTMQRFSSSGCIAASCRKRNKNTTAFHLNIRWLST